MFVTEALAEGRARLAQTESAVLDAALLLSHILGVGREKLYLYSAELSTDEVFRFRECLERRRSGECTAYITGHKEFYGLDFRVTKASLVPRPDTETLVEAALDELSTLHSSPSTLHPSPFSVLDLCTGSGAVAVALKHEKPELDVWAADISGEALELARINAERLLAGRGNAAIRFLHGDLYGPLEGVPAAPKFTVITANAPYVPSAEIAALAKEVQNEPRIALDGGEDGLDLIRRIIEGAPRYLVRCPEAVSDPAAGTAGRPGYGGVLLLEADPSHMREIAAVMERHGFGEIRVRKDLSGRDRVIAGRIAGDRPAGNRPAGGLPAGSRR
ncbi:MAG: peptide chain release factor N(5)-glutamine methyltransferase [Treponema sp.]|jgi:release factor glutamine methyltransferase|nr:peptide chain release factor N(5)-glutamine methyltransferase [Treponema sp.]